MRSQAKACCRAFKNLLGEMFADSPRVGRERGFQLAEIAEAEGGVAGYRVSLLACLFVRLLVCFLLSVFLVSVCMHACVYVRWFVSLFLRFFSSICSPKLVGFTPFACSCACMPAELCLVCLVCVFSYCLLVRPCSC